MEQYENMYNRDLTIHCSSLTSSNLYESKKTLANCDNFMSYSIGENIPLVGTVIKSGICYDIESFALKYANYVAYQRKDIWISNEVSPLDYSMPIINLNKYIMIIK